MDNAPSTQKSLLIRLRDADDADAWQHFVHLYAPLIYHYARRHHLQDADAADLTQEVLHNVSTAIGQLDYDPDRGSFRGWLYTLAHRRLYDFLQRQQKQEQAIGGSNPHVALHQLPAPADDIWETEYQRQLFLWAKDEVQSEFTETTWQAFWRTAVDGQSIADAAQTLNISKSAVYIARSRVQNRLRETIRQATDD